MLVVIYCSYLNLKLEVIPYPSFEQLNIFCLCILLKIEALQGVVSCSGIYDICM
jgi:hypothetical protein